MFVNSNQHDRVNMLLSRQKLMMFKAMFQKKSQNQTKHFMRMVLVPNQNQVIPQDLHLNKYCLTEESAKKVNKIYAV